MRRQGICKKCGKEGEVQDHHKKGYLPPFEDYTEPYCRSCDMKAHYKAKREGRCKLTGKESKMNSANSCHRRSDKKIHITNKRVIPYVSLQEFFTLNKNTGTLTFTSGFFSHKEGVLKVIDEDSTNKGTDFMEWF